jgi:hypothetical protein
LGIFHPVAVAQLFDRTVSGDDQGIRYLSLRLTLALAGERDTLRAP